ncbi:hypothetical protein GCM10022419_080440 [Nonomuraea rosea]|uniref:Uncharacterized protein n=1 Tax=Nonomuraea rosea TaxID=638574 RepID=A0ABP6YNC4_9ACTN
MVIRLSSARRRPHVDHAEGLIVTRSSNGAARVGGLRKALAKTVTSALLVTVAATINPIPAAATSASAACTWKTVETKNFASNNAWLKLKVNGCGKASMQAWWPPSRKFKCSIYSESGQKLNEFTVTAYGCTSAQISVGSKKVYAFVWVTDYVTGKFLATANTGFHRAD